MFVFGPGRAQREQPIGGLDLGRACVRSVGVACERFLLLVYSIFLKVCVARWVENPRPQRNAPALCSCTLAPVVCSNSPGTRTRPRSSSNSAAKKRKTSRPLLVLAFRLRCYSPVDGSKNFLLVRRRAWAMALTRPLLASACARTFFLPELKAAYAPLPVRGLTCI